MKPKASTASIRLDNPTIVFASPSPDHKPLTPPSNAFKSPIGHLSFDAETQSYFLIRRQTLDTESPATANAAQRLRDSNSKSPTALSQVSTRISAEAKRDDKDGKDGDYAETRGESPTIGMVLYNKFRDIKAWNDRNTEGSLDDQTPSSLESQRHALDPPRPARPGLEWVWFPEGYWAERELRDGPGKKRLQAAQRWWKHRPSVSERPKGTSITSDKSIIIPPKPDSPGVKTATRTRSPSKAISQKFAVPDIKIIPRTRSMSKASRQSSKTTEHRGSPKKRPSLKRSPREVFKTGSTDTEEADKLSGSSIYRKTKETIWKHVRSHSTPHHKLEKSKPNSGIALADTAGLDSRTATVIEGASDFLFQHETAQHRLYHAPTTLQSSHTPGGRRHHGRAPWHRRNSHESMSSVASSIHILLMGRTPAPSPHPEQHYRGHDGKTYKRVEISSQDPSEPTFLPSEARRIATPPMSPSASSGTRGFFFDLMAANDEDVLSRASGATYTESPGTSAGAHSASSDHKIRQAITKEWWEADQKHSKEGASKSTQNPAQHKTKTLLPKAFELRLPPDHFPNSPLCPKNPKHPSGGTGICPIHGRQRSLDRRGLAPKRVDTIDSSDGGFE